MCKHQWIVIVNEYEKSPMQKLVDTGELKSFEDGTAAFITGKKIIILQCRICGKLNKTIERV